MDTYTQTQKEIINGYLLSDACLSSTIRREKNGNERKTNSSLIISHGEKQLGLCEWIKSNFNSLCGDIRKRVINRPLDDDRYKTKQNVEYGITIFANSYLTSLEKIWYKRDENGNYIYKNYNGKKARIKIIPNNLILTPLTIATWHIGDGSIDVGHRRIRLCTESFTLDECNYLIEQLKLFNIDSYPQKARSGHRIHVYAQSFLNFVDLVKEYMPPCVQYKVDLTDYIERRKWKLNEEDIKQILQLSEYLTHKEIGVMFNVKEGYITGIVNGRCWRHITNPNYEKPLKSDYIKEQESIGVRFSGIRNRWCTWIYIKNQRTELGAYPDCETARIVRKTAEIMKSNGITDQSQYVDLKNSYLSNIKPQTKSLVFSEKDIIDIKIKLQSGNGVSQIAREYNVTRNTIYAIKNGKTWKHIQLPK